MHPRESLVNIAACFTARSVYGWHRLPSFCQMGGVGIASPRGREGWAWRRRKGWLLRIVPITVLIVSHIVFCSSILMYNNIFCKHWTGWSYLNRNFLNLYLRCAFLFAHNQTLSLGCHLLLWINMQVKLLGSLGILWPDGAMSVSPTAQLQNRGWSLVALSRAVNCRSLLTLGVSVRGRWEVASRHFPCQTSLISKLHVTI